MTERTGDDQLASELALALVTRAAPHEHAIFRAASRAYFDNPNRALRRRSVGNMLGFGADSMAALTPYALAVADAVIAGLKGDASRRGGVLGPYAPEVVKDAAVLALTQARELGLPEDKAQLLAEATAESLGEQTA